MATRKIAQPDGTEMIVRDADFDPMEEKWSEYRLRDGGSVRIRATAQSIAHVLDSEGKPTTLPDGQPNMWVQYQVQIVAREA
jgi:hypothetical protein